MRTRLMWLQLCALFLLCAGLFIMLLPTLQQWYYRMDIGRTITAYNGRVAGMRLAEEDAGEGEAKSDADRLLQALTAYNEALCAGGQTGLADPFAFQRALTPLPALPELGGIAGIVRIPRMELELPVYLQATRANLRRGAALMGDTSVPIGGGDTHAVIAAHRGDRGTALFRGIDRLRMGDRVEFLGPFETFGYRVQDIRIVEPAETAQLRIQPGRELLTLLTCHPVKRGAQRYLVCCERIE